MATKNETAEQTAAREAAQRKEWDAITAPEADNADRVIDDDALSGIKSFKDALEIVGSVADIDSFDDYGTGFGVLDTKAKNSLLGVPFIVAEWRFNEGKMGTFVSATVVTKDDRRLIINDGSTGILKQLQNVTTKRMEKGHKTPQAGLMVERGLRVSEYDYVNEQGVKTPAVTYYLA